MHCNREQQQPPSVGKLGYIGTDKAICLEPYTFIKSGDMQEKHIYIRIGVCCTVSTLNICLPNRRLKDTAFVKSLPIRNALLTYYMQKCLLVVAVLIA